MFWFFFSAIKSISCLFHLSSLSCSVILLSTIFFSYFVLCFYYAYNMMLNWRVHRNSFINRKMFIFSLIYKLQFLFKKKETKEQNMKQKKKKVCGKKQRWCGASIINISNYLTCLFLCTICFMHLEFLIQFDISHYVREFSSKYSNY